MNKKISLGAALCLVLIAVALCFQITYTYLNKKFTEAMEFRDQTVASYEKLYNFDSVVNDRYIGEINDSEIMDGILRGYLSGLGDPHSYYYDAEEYKELELNKSGKMVGIGIVVRENKEKAAIEVVHVHEGSPASNSGIAEGYLIIGVDSLTVADDEYMTVVDAISGEEGGKVTLTVIDTEGKVSELIVTRAIVEYDTVRSRMIGDVALVSITEFNKRTGQEFTTEMDALVKSGVNNFIFDLRNNLGGNLGSVITVLDYILPEGPIIHTIGKGDERESHYSDAKCLEGNICVLMNQYTASAAELFAAAVKEYECGVLVGTLSYGKGTVQSLLEFADGTCLRITTATYLPPFGENFDGIGIEPHVTVEYVEGENGEEDSQVVAALEELEKMKSAN